MSQPRLDTPLLGPAKWVGTAAGISCAILIALNQGVVAYGFGLFFLSSVLWVRVGWMHREASIVLLQGAFTVINVLGLYRSVQL